MSEAVHTCKERPDDIEAIRNLNLAAFGQAQEGQIVDALRTNGGVLLSLVATIGERVVGHPEYYPRFGFRSGSGFGIRSEWELLEDVFMVLVLDESKMTLSSRSAIALSRSTTRSAAPVCRRSPLPRNASQACTSPLTLPPKIAPFALVFFPQTCYPSSEGLLCDGYGYLIFTITHGAPSSFVQTSPKIQKQKPKTIGSTCSYPQAHSLSSVRIKTPGI